jgi:multiple sugar transport system substrate-binding protein
MSDFPTAMITSLAAGANLPDVMAMDMEIIGKLAESAGLEDLAKPPFDALQHSARVPAFALAAARSGKGGLAAFPVDVGPGALFYRTDLLQKAGLSEADLTASWEGFIAAGKILKARTGAYLIGSATDIKDIYIRASLRDGEGVFFDGQGKVLVESPRFIRGFELARAARLAGIDARVAVWSNEWSEGFRRDRIAGQMMGAWLGGHLKNWIAPKLAGQWRSAQLPEGAFSSWGGSFYAIPTKAKHKDLAWAFIRYLALDKEQQLAAFRGLDAFPALIEAQDDAYVDEPLEYFGGQRARQLWRAAARRIPAVDADRYDAIAIDVVNAELEQVLEHSKDIKLALADAKRGIERRVRRRNFQ